MTPLGVLTRYCENPSSPQLPLLSNVLTQGLLLLLLHLHTIQLQAPQLADATLLLTRIPGSDGQRCSGAIILKSNGQQLPSGVAVAYELNGVAASKATTAGRIMVVSPALPAGSTTCSLKLVSVTSPGEGWSWAPGIEQAVSLNTCCQEQNVSIRYAHIVALSGPLPAADTGWQLECRPGMHPCQVDSKGQTVHARETTACLPLAYSLHCWYPACSATQQPAGCCTPVQCMPVCP